MCLERWFYTAPLRLRAIFRRPQIDEELDEEVRYHLDQQIQDHVAKGLAPEEARRIGRPALALRS